MQKYLAEFVGTLFLCYVILVAPKTNMKPLALGAAFAVVVVVLGSVSGAHINPAVTAMMFVAKKIRQDDAVLYILAQMAGGVTAFYLNKNL